MILISALFNFEGYGPYGRGNGFGMGIGHATSFNGISNAFGMGIGQGYGY